MEKSTAHHSAHFLALLAQVITQVAMVPNGWKELWSGTQGGLPFDSFLLGQTEIFFRSLLLRKQGSPCSLPRGSLACI